MKKLAVLVLSLSVLLFAVPLPVHAISSDTQVINKHGSYTYMGAYDDWNDSSWDSDNFTDVTGEDIDCSDNLIIKGGNVGDVTVSDDADLTIYGGTMSDVVCEGSISMTDGTANSLESDSDIDISGGTVQGDVDADESVTLSGKLAVDGSVTGAYLTAYASSSSGNTTVTGDVSFSDSMTVSGEKYKFGSIDGQSSGALTLSNITGTLPAIANVEEINVESGCTVKANGSLEVSNLDIEDGAQLVTDSTIHADTVTGPGTLIFNANNLTIDSGVSGNPVFDFNGTAGDGTTVFRAKSGTVSGYNVTVYGYGLSKAGNSDGYDSFTLSSSTGNGVMLDTSSASVNSGGSATVKATVTPSLSELADGTKLHWELIDPSSMFSILPDTGSNTCKVYLSSSAGASAYKATLAAYLVDSSGTRLSSYLSDSCSVVSSGSAGSSVNSGITLDTVSVNIPIGRTYYVLAVTNSSTPPTQMSYNSAVAIVGRPAAYSSNGKIGWIYPVTAVGKGGVTIDIGGQKMIANVTNGSITVDTASYTLSPGKTYTIGVKLYGTDKNSLNVHSANNCTTVQYKGKTSNGTELYSIRGSNAGTGYILFDTAAGGSVKVQINVVNGAVSHGVGGSLTAIA
jgi:hypothetical protein